MTLYDPDQAVGTHIERVLTLVGSEVMRAMVKWPRIHNIHEGYAVMREELDEYFDACKEQVPNVAQAHHEAIHVAAMAVRTILDTTNGGNAA